MFTLTLLKDAAGGKIARVLPPHVPLGSSCRTCCPTSRSKVCPETNLLHNFKIQYRFFYFPSLSTEIKIGEPF